MKAAGNFFPPRRRIGRRPLNPRVVLNGILWILRNGARWRDLPTEFGNWNSVYHKFRRWIRIGLFVLADKAYSCEQIRDYIQGRGAGVCIPDKVNAVKEHEFNSELYKARNIVERFFQCIKEFRRIAIRFDKLDICFLNFILLASFIRHL